MFFQKKPNGNLLHLMVQSPETLFVYWDMNEDYLNMATGELQDVNPGLHLRLLQQSGEESIIIEEFRIPGMLHHGSAYIYGQKSYAAYYAELGLSYHGGYFTLLRSHIISTPPAQQVSSSFPHTNAQHHAVPLKLPFAYSPQEREIGGETRG